MQRCESEGERVNRSPATSLPVSRKRRALKAQKAKLSFVAAKRRALEELNAKLRFVVLHDGESGRVTVRMFRSPQDIEGLSLEFPPHEAAWLAEALQTPKVHFHYREDPPRPISEKQLSLPGWQTGKGGCADD
jgi:hypothetical protein